MQRDSEEDAWRSIVENYGDRVELDEDSAPAKPAPVAEPDESAEPFELRRREHPVDEEERFVSPPPPPLPRLPPDRLLAWSGLFGSPTILLICLVLDIRLAPWLGYLLVAGFIGGFVYLVVKMPHGPADPWDDGARL